MSSIIKFKIDLTKIEKERLFKSETTGNIYLDGALIPTPNNEYGQTHMIVQSITKEERERGLKGLILGNARELVPENKLPSPGESPAAPEWKKEDGKDDLPF